MVQPAVEYLPQLFLGQFVIGDLTPHSVGTNVMFWGAQWAKTNVLRGGPAPAAFKGYEESSAVPVCGGRFTTAPGNSSNPPSAIPDYMAVIVSTNVVKTGALISGDISEVIIVKTNPGYAANPGHAGTGITQAVVCKAP